MVIITANQLKNGGTFREIGALSANNALSKRRPQRRSHFTYACRVGLL